MNEFDLVEGIKQGKNEAYKYLFTHYYSILCQIAYEFVEDDFISQSIVSDVFFKLWERREKLYIDKSIQRYLIKAVKNTCLDYLNSNAYKKEHSCSQELRDLLFETLADENVTPLENLSSKELENQIDSLLASLSPETRRVFILNRFYNLSYILIAEKLGISVNTVKYHIKKALAYFHTHLKDYLKLLLLFMFK
ncbi:RNA polymerase sigma-70 factor [Parabacteroides pacaensis]|uniref:RNA polymerase sigma-70 factor n=1 Tax=Parabacteroides pacaensis TaxID=2086575 RepID=UPI000D11375B|nr:RNA polymerase sigma-70 factor [Parabacteroides pacaensis]